MSRLLATVLMGSARGDTGMMLHPVPDRYDSMLVKLIKVDVKLPHRERFCQGQTAWRDLRSLEGFCGQTGGWLVDRPDTAVIIGLWADQPSYDRFMADRHDEIHARSGQRDTYTSGRVTLWNRRLVIPGRCTDFAQAVAGGCFMRISVCRLAPRRRAHFVEVQQNVWNPGISGAGGIEAGVFCESADSADSFLVCTLWRSEEHYYHYQERTLDGLRSQAQVDTDCESERGLLVRLEPAWRVAV